MSHITRKPVLGVSDQICGGLRHMQKAEFLMMRLIWHEICFHMARFTEYYKALQNILYNYHLSLLMRKPAFCICENKDADQIRSSREADQRLCFCQTDSAIPLLSKSEISSL